MKLLEKDIELIEKYIDGDLSVIEVELFEKRLDREPYFNKEYQKRIKIEQLWNEASNYQKTKDEIKDALKIGKFSFLIAHKYSIISVAASIIMLFGVYLLFFEKDQGIFGDPLIVHTDSSTLTKDSISFQIDEPANFATVETLYNPAILISPTDNHLYTTDIAIVLKWKSSSRDSDTLYVVEKTATKVMIMQAVQQQKDTAEYRIKSLPGGDYDWYLNDTLYRKSFIISKRN